jgi:hypothetical protein
MSQRISAPLEILGCMSLLVACASTSTPDAEQSGFLGDYSQLKPGRGDQAQLVFIDPEADFSPYERILIDPVVVWEPTAGADASNEELRALADELGAALREQLQLEFMLVESPEPGTLRIRTAITGVRESGASIELEVLDAVSGRRLVAVDDARGSTSANDPAPKWASAREAFDFWAKRARVRLAAFRSFDASEAAHDARSEP